MIKIDVFNVKTHFSALLDEVKCGEAVFMSKRGKAIENLISAEQLIN